MVTSNSSTSFSISEGGTDGRRNRRSPGRANAEIVRDLDTWRRAHGVELIDVSLAGVGFVTSETLVPGERVRVLLKNVVQRFTKELRGVVQWSTPLGDGQHRVGVELESQFSALDMQFLKRAGVQLTTQAARAWV
jgi:PilZ domain